MLKPMIERLFKLSENNTSVHTSPFHAHVSFNPAAFTPPKSTTWWRAVSKAMALC